MLGRAVDSIADPSQAGDGKPGLQELLDQYVKDQGGTVIFCRGEAFQKPSSTGLEPVLWSDKSHNHVHLDPTAEGRRLSAFQILNNGEGGMDALPDMVDGKIPGETQPLTSVLAMGTSREDTASQPAIMHRR